jgi:hypothetical protein
MCVINAVVRGRAFFGLWRLLFAAANRHVIISHRNRGAPVALLKKLTAETVRATEVQALPFPSDIADET